MIGSVMRPLSFVSRGTGCTPRHGAGRVRPRRSPGSPPYCESAGHPRRYEALREYHEEVTVVPGALVGARDVLYSARAARRTALAVPVIDFRSSHCGGPGCAPIAQLDRASDYES